MFDTFLGKNFMGANVMGANFMGTNTNLGTNMDKHMEQGVEFNSYSKAYTKDNEHKLLEVSSAPQWGSIVEAFNDPNSINLQSASMQASPVSAHKTSFDSAVSNYARSYNTYTSTMLKKSPTDADRTSLESSLSGQHMSIIAAASRLSADISSDGSSLGDGNISIPPPPPLPTRNNYDSNTIEGITETSTLNMESMYYHYFVYFAICVTLIAFTFNIMVNPNANVSNAIYVVCALLAVYFIARQYAV
jgi:hypothetical protein